MQVPAVVASEPESPEDLYATFKKLQQQLEFLKVQEDYIKVHPARLPPAILILALTLYRMSRST